MKIKWKKPILKDFLWIFGSVWMPAKHLKGINSGEIYFS